MEGNVSTPFGDVKKQTAVFGGVALALVLGVAWYRSKKNAAASATASAGASSIDPATGYAFGTPEDAAAMSNQGSYTFPTGYGGGNTSVSTGTTSGIAPGSFTNNSQWAQYVETYMMEQGIISDANALGSAIGKYLSGQPLTGDMQTLVNQAVAFGGFPPNAGPTGYPPSINTTPVSTPVTNPSGTFANNQDWINAGLTWYKANKPKWGSEKLYYAMESYVNGIPIWRDEWVEIGRIIGAIGPPPAPANNGLVKFLGS